MGSGKTTVSRMFSRLGARAVNADRIAHGVMKPETVVWKKLVRTFGKGILGSDHHIDRKKLSKIVFTGKRDKLEVLNSIVHPMVIAVILSQIAKAKREHVKVFVIDAPLLIESGLDDVCDKLITVTAKSSVQRKRIRERGELPEDEIKRRMDSQMPVSEKVMRADYVVDNSSDLKKTWQQVRKIWGEIK